MPQKAKFTREEILDAALAITEKSGIDSVTARELGNYLGSSARPVFTVFDNMDEVKESVRARAKELYGKYAAEGLKEPLAFKGVGLAYIRFAIEKPELFRLLFMQPPQSSKDVADVLPMIDDHYDLILQSVQNPYKLDRAAAEKLYQHLWTYTHGIAAMLVTGLCSYKPEQIEERITEIFKGLLLSLDKGINYERQGYKVERKTLST